MLIHHIEIFFFNLFYFFNILKLINIKIFTIFFVIDIEELELSYKAFSISLLDFIIVKHEYKQERTIVKIANIISVLFFSGNICYSIFYHFLITPLYFYSATIASTGLIFLHRLQLMFLKLFPLKFLHLTNYLNDRAVYIWSYWISYLFIQRKISNNSLWRMRYEI